MKSPAMVTTAPHYILFSEARTRIASGRAYDATGRVSEAAGRVSEATGQWRFVLESADGETLLDVHDEEVDDRDRLELLAVVRGLEAIDQPSRVTLVSSSRYVSNGLRRGLPEWRDNGWLWERFGELVPITNSDLWQRIDRALRFHRVHCRMWRFDEAHGGEWQAPQTAHTAVPRPHAHFAHRRSTNGRLHGAAHDRDWSRNKHPAQLDTWWSAPWLSLRLRRLLHAFYLRVRLWWSATLLSGTGI